MKALLLLLLVAAASQWAAVPPDSREIIRKSVDVVEANWTQAPNYSFTERASHSKKRSEPVVKTFRVSMIDGAPYRYLVAVDDRPLRLDQQTVEECKLAGETEKRRSESEKERAQRVYNYSKERNRDHAILMEIADAFDFEFAGEETVNGHDCWVLDARPRQGYTPKNHAAKVLTAMTLRLWVEKSQNQWVKVEAELFQPISFYGLLAKVGPGTRFMLEQEPITDTVWLPTRFSMRLNASALGFINENSTNDNTYSNYTPNTQKAARLEVMR
jgi:hypothetical protein